MDTSPPRLTDVPAHLGRDGAVRALPPFDGTGEWYARYEADTAADGNEGRLVSMFTFDSSWEAWEMHPVGHELVLCVEGTIHLVQERGGEHTRTTLTAGQWVVNEPGVWHTADIDDGSSATCVFITAGSGTEGRAR